jgi:nicotinamide-nucleotide amidase
MALRNAVGTAAGMWFNVDGVIYVSMPGVPYEMMHLMESSILPMLSQQFNAPYIMHHTLLTQGIGESILAEKIHDWEEALPEGVKLAYLPSVSAVRLRLSGSGEDQEKLKNEFDAQLLKLKALVGKYCYGENNDTLESVLGQLLRAQNKTLATAESCTGGQIAASITKVPGCSNYFKGGVIAYSNDVKVNQLNVFQSDLDAYGAVSKPVVESMAKGVIKLLDVDYAIATSGVAGPDGGSVEKPVGTVWIAVASRTEVYAQQFLFGKHRERNIQAATLTALNLMRRMLQGTLDVADYSVK